MPTLCHPTNDLLITSVLSGLDVNLKHLTSVWKVCGFDCLLELEKLTFFSEFFFPHISFNWYLLRIITDNVNINIPNVHIIPTLFYDIFYSRSGKFALKKQDNFLIIRNHFLYKNSLFL